jgi:hypothetical protein
LLLGLRTLPLAHDRAVQIEWLPRRLVIAGLSEPLEPILLLRLPLRRPLLFVHAATVTAVLLWLLLLPLAKSPPALILRRPRRSSVCIRAVRKAALPSIRARSGCRSFPPLAESLEAVIVGGSIALLARSRVIGTTATE